MEAELGKSNKNLTFEYSRELSCYREAFTNVFSVLETHFDTQQKTRLLYEKNIWIATHTILYVFKECDGVLKRHHVFYIPTTLQPTNLDKKALQPSQYYDYFLSYYRSYPAPAHVLINFTLNEKELIEQFLYEWSGKQIKTSILHPTKGHFANLIKLAELHVQHHQKQLTTTPKALKTLFKLEKEPITIDCFDISHKQGTYQVGSCVRFKNGQPDKYMLILFHIKTVDQQDDYACLREIVKRRYQKHQNELPDLILIDGGKGQLNAISDLFPETECASLAKREETIFSKRLPKGKKLNIHTFAGQLLIALRDYTHHFAVSFHRKIARVRR